MSWVSLVSSARSLPVPVQDDHHDLAVSDLEPPSRPSSASFSDSSTGHELLSEGATLRWRPRYLTRRALLGFLLVFTLILVAVEVLLFTSNKDNGIATSTSDKHYLWTYGPTAFLTVVAAMWTRVEYQSKLITPWIRLSQPGTPVSQTLLRDYISPFSGLAFFTSLRSRDFMVSITIAVGLAIKAIIVISTGLITLTWTRVQGSYPMVIQDEFLDSDNGLRSAGTISLYIMQGLLYGNLSPPKGISSHYAFQSVQTNLPASAETRVTVDGLATWLHCQPADVELIDASPPRYHDYQSLDALELSIHSPECNVTGLSVHGVQWQGQSLETSTSPFARFTETRCDGTTGDSGRRIFVTFGILSYFADYLQYDIYDGEPQTTLPYITGPWTLQHNSCVCQSTHWIRSTLCRTELMPDQLRRRNPALRGH
ncbi:hypothetical protein PG985_009680 [Apiospora marii]|uniref:Uncharacterized protein n=1 Tax=Apiospora marii TaxID=335849 RepID=A0ABR1RFZ0_9PEZI